MSLKKYSYASASSNQQQFPYRKTDKAKFNNHLSEKRKADWKSQSQIYEEGRRGLTQVSQTSH